MLYYTYMTTVQSIILGCVEGFTEFLPISSTGHMILTAHFLHITQSATLATFEIVVQLGAILAVVITYHKELRKRSIIQKLLVAFIPTGIAGLVIFPYIKYLLGSSFLVAIMLIIGGIAILLVEIYYTKKGEKKLLVKAGQKDTNPSHTTYDISHITYTQALILGTFQALAIIPGVSRSGAVIVGGLLQRIGRAALVEFTFLLAVPTMFAATFYSLYKNKDLLTLDYAGTLFLGTLVAFMVALFVIKIFLSYIKKFDFVPFGVYRIVLGFLLTPDDETPN